MIEHFEQGLDASMDRKLFGFVGARIADAEVHKELGSAITSKPGDYWWLAIGSKSDLRGFATGRRLKNGTMHLRFIWVGQDGGLVYRALAKRAIEHARSRGFTAVWTNDRASRAEWLELGFVANPHNAPTSGGFIRWECKFDGEEA